MGPLSPAPSNAADSETNTHNGSTADHPNRLGVLRLAALLFFGVSGGPLGTEGLVNAAGPLYSLIGLCVLPLFWCFPVGLMTAELSTAFPKDGGYVWWVDAAFGRFWGFMMGWVSWASGLVDNAIYPGMFLSFLIKSFELDLSSWAKQGVLLAFNLVLTMINLFGLEVAGSASVVFCGVVLAPVAVLVFVSLPMNPSAWLLVPTKTNWVRWVNIALWNTNGFDSISTIGGEVSRPNYTYPVATLIAGFAVILPYMLCIMAATADDDDYSQYENGTYNIIARRQGGWLLGALFTVGTSAAAAGMFLSDMTTYSYQLSGMAEDGMVPRIFAAKLPQVGTPYVAICLQSLVVMMLSHMDFHEILMCDNLLYSCALLLELCAMIKLRVSQPNLARPFKIPTNTTGVVVLMCGPAFFCGFIFVTSSMHVLLTSALICAAGVGLWYFMGYAGDVSGNANLNLPFSNAASSQHSYNAL